MAGTDSIFYQRLLEDFSAQLYVAAPARVIKLNPDRTADVVPLFKEDGAEASPLLGVPYLRHIEAGEGVSSIKKGSAVWLNFADRAIDNMVGAKSFDPEFSRRHERKDAVIVGVF
ncbi:hypothetical protein AWH48_11595 [Domibacillus aminovorans]|uniref:Phage protein Gp138 N-terminal domain-containing protein n=1 Tax=Domibacillus aminovorans TaxID=29332 RepID=A0A177KLY6_9BACI|nr:hypothetical protein [Domibacillus aminovorans]OAH53905.1 hypothetical protein AWH48_11595 [Domibacillus aminovorans]